MGSSEQPETAIATAAPAVAGRGGQGGAGPARREAPAALAPTLKPGSVAFDIARNMHYHAAREAYLGFCSRLTKAASLITGAGATAAFLARLEQPWLAAGLAALVVVLQMIDLVFDLPGRALEHATLRQKFAALNGRLFACGEDADQLRSIQADMVSLYGEEPPAYMVVDAMAWNATYRSTRSRVGEDELIPIGWWDWAFAQVLRRDDFDSRTGAERTAQDA